MKLKLLAGAIALAASALANASYVTVDYQMYDSQFAAIGSSGVMGSGNLASNNYVGSNTLVATANLTPYYVHLWISAPTVPSGYTLGDIKWSFADNLYVGGSVTSIAGGTLTTATANTSVTANNINWGTQTLGSTVFSDTLNAYHQKTSGFGNAPLAWNAGDVYYLTSDGTSTGSIAQGAGAGAANYSGGTGALDMWVTLASVNTTSASGNVDAQIRNYANVVAAADVVLLPPPSVPEPATLLLASLGLMGIGASRRAKKA